MIVSYVKVQFAIFLKGSSLTAPGRLCGHLPRGTPWPQVVALVYFSGAIDVHGLDPYVSRCWKIMIFSWCYHSQSFISWTTFTERSFSPQIIWSPRKKVWKGTAGQRLYDSASFGRSQDSSLHGAALSSSCRTWPSTDNWTTGHRIASLLFCSPEVCALNYSVCKTNCT